MIMKDVCIIAQGGGIKSAYNAGVIKGLRERFSVNEVKDVVAVSGTAAIFMYFVSKQYDLIEKIWLELLRSKEFIRFKNFFNKRSLVDIDYLVDVFVKERFPFDIASFKNTKTKMYVPVTRVADGEAVYFSNKDDIDYFELIRATCAIPYFYGKSVKIKDDFYIDGTICDVFGLNKALELKPKNLLVILTDSPKKLPEAFLIRKLFDVLLLHNESHIIRKRVWDVPKKYEKERAYLKLLKKSMNLVIIQPKNHLPSLRLDSSLKHLMNTIQQGYDDVINHPELEAFFKKVKSI